MKKPHFYRISVSSALSLWEEGPSPYSLSVESKKRVSFSSCLNHLNETEVIDLLRSSGAFTNMNRQMKYRLSILKVNGTNPSQQITLCTRFYRNISDVYLTLKQLVDTPMLTVDLL